MELGESLSVATVASGPTTWVTYLWQSASTEDIAELLFTSVLCKGFLPSTVISDRDTSYTSDLWTAVMMKLGTKIELTTPYHQQADPAERSIQTVQNILRCYSNIDWVNRLPYVEMAK
jgi:hypothetical protein